jgi:hypothetical protein
MEKEEIKRLLEKYYNGESTEKEEGLLKELFASETVPEDFEHDKALFNYFRHVSKMPEPSPGFESRILSAAADDRMVPVRPARKILVTVLAIAAGVALITGSYFFLKRGSEPRDTYSDPAVAYAETMKILHGVSYRLSYGRKSLEPVGKLHKLTKESLVAFESPAKIVDEKLKSLNQLNRTVKTLGTINSENETIKK